MYVARDPRPPRQPWPPVTALGDAASLVNLDSIEEELGDGGDPNMLQLSDLTLLETGDLLLFHGESHVARVAQMSRGCDFCTVAMVVRVPELEGIPLLLEATAHASSDTEPIDCGACLVALQTRAYTWASALNGNRVVVRRLSAPNDAIRARPAIERVLELRKKKLPNDLSVERLQATLFARSIRPPTPRTVLERPGSVRDSLRRRRRLRRRR